MRVKNKSELVLADGAGRPSGKRFGPGEATGDVLFVAPVYQVLRGSICAYTPLDIILLPDGGEHRPRIGERIIELDSGEVFPLSEAAFRAFWEEEK